MTETDVRQNQHYVPKLLLRNFASNLPAKKGKEKIYVFDREKKCSFTPNIKNIAAEFGYYDLELPEGKISFEDHLGKIETSVADVIEKIKKDKSLAGLTVDDWAWFGVFCASLFTRGQSHREMIAGMEAAIRNKIRDVAKDSSADEAIFPRESEMSSKAFVLHQMIEGTKEFHTHFTNKVPILMEAPKGSVFYIGDNPISLHNAHDFSPYGNLGLAVEGIQIYLPITPQLTVAMFHPSILVEFSNDLKKIKAFSANGLNRQAIEHTEALLIAAQNGSALQLTAENVMFNNSLQVSFSSRFVMSSRREFSLLERMLADGATLGPASMLRV